MMNDITATADVRIYMADIHIDTQKRFSTSLQGRELYTNGKSDIMVFTF